MNYVHYTLIYLIGLIGDVVSWLFNIELVNYEDTSISFGDAFVYFFIAFLVISLLLNARYGNIGVIAKERSAAKKASLKAANKTNKGSTEK